MRCVITRVLPDPAPASRRTGPSTDWIPSCCCGFIFFRSSINSHTLHLYFKLSIPAPGHSSQSHRKHPSLMSTCEQTVRSWTGVEAINFCATNQVANLFFSELSANNLRTSAHDELSEPWQKTPVELKISGAIYEEFQSSHYRRCRYLSACSSGCLCRSCEYFVSGSRDLR